MKQAFIVGSDKGGVGKTEVACQIYLKLLDLDAQVGFGEVDSVQRASALLGSDVDVSLKLTEDLLAQVSAHPLAAEQFFGPLLDVLADPDSDAAVVDLGATVSGQVLDWMQNQDALELMEDEQYRPVFVAVTAPEASALAGAVRFIEKAQRLAGDRADYVLALNDTLGSGFDFIESAGSEKDLVDRVKAQHELHVVTLPHARRTKLISFARRFNLGLHEVYRLGDALKTLIEDRKATEDPALKQLEAELGLVDLGSRAQRLLSIRTEVREVLKWLVQTHAAFDVFIDTGALAHTSSGDEEEVSDDDDDE